MPTIQQNQAAQREAKRAEAIDGVAAAIKPVSEFALSEPARFCFYGEPKSGKTSLAASSGLNTLVIESDPGGLEPLAGRQGVSAYKLERWEQMDALFWYVHAGKHDYEAIVFDTVTMMRTICLRWTMDNETRLDPLTPQTPHHQKVARILNNEILRWTTLPYTLIFLAQPRNLTVKKEELGGEDVLQRIVPDLPPSPLSTLLAAVGTIGRIYTKEVQDPEDPNKIKIQHRLLLAPNDTFYAGTRIRGLPKLMVVPDDQTGLKQILAVRAMGGEAEQSETDGLPILMQDLFDEEYAARQSATDVGVNDDAVSDLPTL